MKRRVPFEGAHVAWKQSEANRAAAIAVIDAVDQRRQFLAPVIVGREQVRLMLPSHLACFLRYKTGG